MQVRFPGRPSVAARTFPSEDPAFADEVARALETSSRDADDADALRQAVTRRLRAAYPDARVVPQLPMASVVDSEELWYVYRDGSVGGSARDPGIDSSGPAPRVDRRRRGGPGVADRPA